MNKIPTSTSWGAHTSWSSRDTGHAVSGKQLGGFSNSTDCCPRNLWQTSEKLYLYKSQSVSSPSCIYTKVSLCPHPLPSYLLKHGTKPGHSKDQKGNMSSQAGILGRAATACTPELSCGVTGRHYVPHVPDIQEIKQKDPASPSWKWGVRQRLHRAEEWLHLSGWLLQQKDANFNIRN